MEKVKETKNMFMDKCKRCNKEIKGHTKNEVRENMKRHKGSKACKK